MIHYSASDARKHFSEILNRVRFEKIIIAVGRNDKDEVLIVPSPNNDADFSISSVNAASPSFAFLEGEPDIYSLKDLKKRYV